MYVRYRLYVWQAEQPSVTREGDVERMAGEAPQTDIAPPPTAADLLRGYLEHSPFCLGIGLRAESIEQDRVRLSMPFREALVTVGDVVHGGAISALIDTAATAAAWSGLESAEGARGTTVSLTVSFLAAARAQDLTADARVVKRGRSICFCEVDVAGADGRAIAKGLVTYKLG
jgi:uncharacterized protein (TIGR00369 family)